MEPPMTRRRITLALGGAVAGLVGAWLAPASVAFADSFDVDPGSAAADPASYTLDPVKPETVTGIYNMYTAPPGINESLQGYEQFNVMDGSNDLGTVDAYEATSPYLTPYLPGSGDALTSSQVIYVDSQVPGAPDASSPGALPDGSVVSTTWSFGHTFENIYAAIPGATPADDVVTDTLKTPFGNIDLSSLVQGFDASNVPPALPDYISGVGDPTVTSVNGLPPLTIDLQGTQSFDYFDANGNPDGTFTALETTTKDIAGFHTEALLVTADTGSGGNPPPVGSVFNTIDFDNLQNVYSSIPGADGKDVVTDILTNTSTGNSINLSSLFASSDASAGLTDGSNVQSFFDGTGYTIAPAPDAQETFTGVNGLPPGNATIQGAEEFSVYNSSGESIGTFNADVTTIPQMSFSNPVETLVVTSDTPGTDPVGTAPGDLPPVGSVFDVSYGDGNESVYSDLAATSSGGHDVISDWLATPTLGNFDLSPFYQSTDASNGLGSSGGLASLMDTAWLDLFGNSSAEAISNSAASSADALAASVDPSAAASLADPSPHIDAALQFLAGLF
jgi:hypothetical protein